MNATRLFTLERPLCAVEEAGARTTALCPICGRARRSQTGKLSVSLVCRSRAVWLTDGNAVLVREDVAMRLHGMPGLDLTPLHAPWADGIPGATEQVPSLLQMRPRHEVHASPGNLRLEDCSCGSVRSISFNPLVVRHPLEPSVLAWYLSESPDALILSAALRDLLAATDGDLEFAEVRYEETSASA
jgi:hypothetical protein